MAKKRGNKTPSKTALKNLEALLDYALGIGGDPENWVEGDEANTFSLVRHCPNDPDEPIGSTIDPADLAEVVEYFDRIHGAEGFHLIENILLRKRSIGDPFLGVQLPDDEMGECPKVPEDVQTAVGFFSQFS